MQKIIPFLWFDDQAEAAMAFYTAVFPDSEVVDVSRYGEAGPGKPGTVMTGTVRLAGHELMVLNGGPEYRFTPAISLVVRCRDQAEVDYYWQRLGDGGTPGPCGWLEDRFGVSWQIVPDALGGLVGGPDPAGAKRATEAMLQMGKLDVAALERAYRGE